MNAGVDLRLLRTAVFTAVCVTLSAAGHSLTGGQRVPWWSLGAGFVLVFVIAAPLAGRERSLPGIAALLAAGQIGLHTLFSFAQHTTQAPMRMPMRGHGGGSDGGAGLRRFAAQLLCNEHAAGTVSNSRARRIISDAGLGTGQLHTGHLHGPAAGHAHGAADAVLSAAGPPLACLRSAARAAVSCLDAPMLLGHLLAALVVGWLLRRGETALWRLVQLSARAARTAVTRVRAMGTALAYVRALGAGLLPRAPARVAVTGSRQENAPPSVLLHHSVHRRGPPRRTQTESFTLAA